MEKPTKEKKKQFMLPSALRQLQQHKAAESKQNITQPNNSSKNCIHQTNQKKQKSSTNTPLFSNLISNPQLSSRKYPWTPSGKEANQSNYSPFTQNKKKPFHC